MELSSMGIRVNKETLRAQLKERGCEDRASLKFHSMLLDGKLVQTIGGGIGQSRLCMYFLRKAHIGETQVSTWSEDMISKCEKANIAIL
jgi:aspartate--ammonia ligase